MATMNEERVPDTLASDFAALGLDLRSSGFPQRYVEQWIGNRTQIARYERLLEHMRLRETAEVGGITAPDHAQKPGLGTTVGDLGESPLGQGPHEDTDAFVEELRQRLENLFNQGGIRVGRGEAGSTSSRDPLEGSSPKGGESGETRSDLAVVIELIMTVWNALNAQAAKDKAEAQAELRALKEELAELKARTKRLEDAQTKRNAAKRPVVDEVNPGGTLSVGGMAPKKPGEPGDPIPDDPRTEASHVLRQTGQATDPNPAADQFGPGALKTIRTTSDAVTDPPPSTARVGLLRRFLGRSTPK